MGLYRFHPRLVAAVLLGFLVSSHPVLARQADPIDDDEFWRLITELSEPGGRFPPQLMSNEDSALHVIPDLGAAVAPGGVLLGVGSEQNFTYIAATRPRLAFVIDIRLDNMLQHLLLKALFELSSNRADFVSMLFGRELYGDLNSDSGIEAIFDAFGASSSTDQFFERTRGRAFEVLVEGHGFPLTEADREGIARLMDAFRNADPVTLRGFGDNQNPTFARLMAATDLKGTQQSFLASEDRFAIVKALQEANRIVPVVGDFAGDTAIRNIADYLRDAGETVDVFYLSNVERYLFDQDNAGRFFANVRALPRSEGAMFIRSVTTDISVRLGIPIPDGPERWRSFVSPIGKDLEDFESGRISEYRDLFGR